jgi:hypothetical protein
MAERFAPGDYDQLHHFIADGVWDAAPLESELLIQADRLVGGKDAVLVIDAVLWRKRHGGPKVIWRGSGTRPNRRVFLCPKETAPTGGGLRP